MKKSFIMVCILPVFLLTACEKTYTVDYWEGHPDERKAYLKACKNGEHDSESTNCKNASRSAMRHIGL